MYLKPKYVFVFTFTFLFSLFSHASNLEKSTPALYQAEKNGLTLFLMGSIPACRTNPTPLPGYIQQAFAQSNSLFLEVDPQLAESQLSRAMIFHGEYSLPYPLEKRMPPSTFQKLLKSMRDSHLQPDNFKYIKDWVVVEKLSEASLRQSGLVISPVIEQHFTQLAITHGKEVKGLEDVDHYIQSKATVNELGSNAIYQDFIQEHPGIKPWLLALERAWRMGDSQQLQNLYQSQNERSRQASARQKRVTHQNRHWRDRILDLPKDKTYMVIVDDQHIHGQNSLLTYLKHAGFYVHRISGKGSSKHKKTI